MITSNLDHQDRVNYSALSYTWGRAFRKQPDSSSQPQLLPRHWIQCNGARLRVLENLYSGLIRIRDTGFTGFFWIDAICINQEDLDERSAQVGLMAEIYAGAEKVVVWLGEEDEHSKIALPLIHRLWNNVADSAALRAKLPTYLTFNDPNFYRDIGQRPITTSEWKSICEFFRRTWFSRLWVVQELVFARDVSVLCGESIWPWDDFLVLAIHLYITGWWIELTRLYAGNSPPKRIGFEILIIIHRLSSCPGDGPNKPTVAKSFRNWVDIEGEHQKLCAFFVYVLDHTRAMSASDPRDKTYAILPLTTWYQKDSGQSLPLPNYRKTTPEVYREFTCHVLRESQGLFFLSWVEDKRRRRRADLPSWVPDLSVEMAPLPLINIRQYHATSSWKFTPRKWKN
jgi:hypothetical protein